MADEPCYRGLLSRLFRVGWNSHTFTHPHISRAQNPCNATLRYIKRKIIQNRQKHYAFSISSCPCRWEELGSFPKLAFFARMRNKTSRLQYFPIKKFLKYIVNTLIITHFYHFLRKLSLPLRCLDVRLEDLLRNLRSFRSFFAFVALDTGPYHIRHDAFDRYPHLPFPSSLRV